MTSSDPAVEKHRKQQVQKYWEGNLARRAYLLRRQRKAVLERCRRIAVVGASSDPESGSFVTMEKMLGLGLEIIPICPERESLLGLRCYRRLTDFPGKIDIVQVYPGEAVDIFDLARQAVAKQVSTFWVEGGVAVPSEVEEILAHGCVHLVEYENLETEYLKHTSFPTGPAAHPRRTRKAVRVRDRMTRNPATVKPEDGLKEAAWKMERGHFRHLPVVDESGKLIGMLTDRDVRLIRPSLAFLSREDAMVQLWAISVQQAAAFDPIRVYPDTPLVEAADLMLRWQVGGLPVVDEQDRLLGIITYTDILREFVGRERS